MYIYFYPISNLEDLNWFTWSKVNSKYWCNMYSRFQKLSLIKVWCERWRIVQYETRSWSQSCLLGEVVMRSFTRVVAMIICRDQHQHFFQPSPNMYVEIYFVIIISLCYRILPRTRLYYTATCTQYAGLPTVATMLTTSVKKHHLSGLNV